MYAQVFEHHIKVMMNFRVYQPIYSNIFDLQLLTHFSLQKIQIWFSD